MGFGAGCRCCLLVGFGELAGTGGGLGRLFGDLERVEVLPVLLVGQPLQLHRLLAELGERHRGAGRGGDVLGGRERGAGGVVRGQDDRDGQVTGGRDGVGELPGLLGVDVSGADQDPRQGFGHVRVAGLLVDLQEQSSEVGDDGAAAGPGRGAEASRGGSRARRS